MKIGGRNFSGARIGLVVLFLGAYLTVGLVKWRYVINPGVVEGGILINRVELKYLLENEISNIAVKDYFILNPKWISIIVFGNVFLFLNLSIIYLVYENKKYIRFTFWFFFWISFTCFIALGIGYFTNTFHYVAPLVARIKELQQSPFALMVLIGVFEIMRKVEMLGD